VTYPDANTMAVLAHMLEAEGVNYHEEMDSLSVVVRGVPYRCEFEEWDELTRRGWVACAGERAEVTEAGRHWCRRWMRANGVRIKGGA